MTNYNRLCDNDCNHCPWIYENGFTRELTLFLNLASDKFGEEFLKLINKTCPNLSVCVVCRVDDFTHVEGCSILKELES